MLYINNISDKLPHNATQIDTVSILDIRYVINATGKIEISIRTNSHIYEEFVRASSKKPKTKIEIVDVNEIRPNDCFSILYTEDEQNIFEYWMLMTRTHQHEGISTTQEPTHCPVCQAKLLFDEDGLYCVNSICPAQIKMTIRKFLFFASGGQFIYSDFKIFDLMITQSLLKSPVDLFSMTAHDLFAVGCRFDFAENMVNSIQSLRGNVTISQYLKSLNVNISDFSIFNPLEPNRLAIAEQLIDQSFHSVAEFLDWWKFIIITPGQSPEPYMNETTFIAINNYLNYPENLKIFYELDSLGLFKYI